MEQLERFRRELVVAEGAGHFVWEEDPARCAEAVTVFLGRRL